MDETAPTIAIVMSGGGNRGALEAGALVALLEAGIKPEMLVGTSAGALNAAFLATNPTLEGAQKLAALWRAAKQDDFYAGNWLSMVLRFARGQSLFPNDGLRRFAEANIPAAKRTFGALPIQLYITAANLNNGVLYLWGDDPSADIIEAALASSALPVAFPPFKLGNFQLVDGGVVANVPVGVAVDKGATEIYVLNVTYAGEPVPDRTTPLAVLSRAFDLIMYQQLVFDLKYASRLSNIKVNQIALEGFYDLAMWDLTQSAAMVEAGKKAVKEFLDDPLGKPSGGGEAIRRPAPSGAHEYVPPWLR